MAIRITTWPQLLAERKAAVSAPEPDVAPAPKKKPAAKKKTVKKTDDGD